MGFLAKIRSQRAVLSGAQGSGMREPLALQRKRPAILLGTSVFEFGQLASNRVDARLKVLAQVKTSALVGCPF